MSRNRFQGNSDQLRRSLAGGLIPATPIPFAVDGKLHVQAHESYLRYMSTQSIVGVAVWAHTGRGLLLDNETAQQVLKDWRSVLPDKVIIAGVGTKRFTGDYKQATRSALEMAESAVECGADALLAYPPTWLREHSQRDRLIVEHHERLSQIGLPVVLFYLYEAAGGIGYNPKVLDELLMLPNVIGVKVATLDSVMTYQDIAAQLQANHPDQLLITGEDRFLGYSLQRGARAALIGIGAICCELQSELIKAYVEKDSNRFLELSNMVDRLAEVLFVNPIEGYIRRILCGLSHLGIIPFEGANDPWGPEVTAAEIKRIAEVVNGLAACTA
jgi:4-hydroxy-tetrahydrodipicolinate synthase